MKLQYHFENKFEDANWNISMLSWWPVFFKFSLMILFVRFDFVIDYGLLISAYVLRIIHSAILLGRIKNTIQKMCRDSGE